MPHSQKLHFADFVLDVGNRGLERGGTPVDLNSRYFDALALLVRSRGELVGKQRFFDEVWSGMVVTDSALTQCIKDVRRALGDDASNPRFIRTVPGHGYKFIAPVREAAVEKAPEAEAPAVRGRGDARMKRFVADCVAGTLGGGVAGIVAGLVYGSGLAYSPTAEGLGALTVLLVVVALNVVAGLAGGFGIAIGMAAGRLAGTHPAWTVAGAACSGFVIGGILKLLGNDAFTLLFGHSPGAITGALEGAVMGISLAGGALLAGTLDAHARWRPIFGAAIACGIAGVLLTTFGGNLMGGSLRMLAETFAGSRLDLDALGRFFGERGFGANTRVALGAIEGLVFGCCVATAFVVAKSRR